MWGVPGCGVYLGVGCTCVWGVPGCAWLKQEFLNGGSLSVPMLHRKLRAGAGGVGPQCIGEVPQTLEGSAIEG